MLSNLPNVPHTDKSIKADVAGCTPVLYPETFRKHVVNICTWHAWKFRKVSACLWMYMVDRWVTDWNTASFMLCKSMLIVLEVSKVNQLKWHPYWEACFQLHLSAAEPQTMSVNKAEEGERAFQTQTQVCAQAWRPPFPSAKFSSRREFILPITHKGN